jgi:Protein of unknown function (DUF3822)
MTQSKTNNVNTNQANRLSVQVSLTGLSFLISSEDTPDHQLVEVPFETARSPEELTLEIDNVFSEQNWQNKEFAEVKLIHTSLLYTVVPSVLFDETKASEYLKFNTKILSTDFVSYDEVENQDLVVVYLPFVNANNFIFDKFGSFSYFHSITLLLSHFLKIEKFAKEPKVYIHVQKDFFDCIVVNGHQLMLCNSYSYKTPEDFIYFILFCFEQLKLNPNEIKTVLCGAVQRDSELFEIIYTYVRNVSFYEIDLGAFSKAALHEQLILKTSL